MDSPYFYILLLAAVSYLLRALPMLLFRKEIENPFLRSFLFYVPYITLALMTFPAILNATDSVLEGAAAMAAGCLLAWKGKNLFQVAAGCCAAVLILELIH